MIKFLRSFFGLNDSVSNRTVVGNSASFDSKEIVLIKESNERLTALANLYKKYKGTVHADKIKSVYEKTKKIHAFLLSKKRVYELELFHIQNTEHFINTFTLIIDVHQRHKENKISLTELESEVTPAKEPEVKAVPVKEPEVHAPTLQAEPVNGRSKGELFEIAERVKQRNKQQTSVVYTAEANAELPMLAIPEVSIDTIAKVFYFREDASGKLVSNEISFISTQQEKEAFQSYVSARLGMNAIYYVGNTRINIPYSKDGTPEKMVPIIYWSKFSYALTLHDYRIFPVTINRRSL